MKQEIQKLRDIQLLHYKILPCFCTKYTNKILCLFFFGQEINSTILQQQGLLFLNLFTLAKTYSSTKNNSWDNLPWENDLNRAFIKKIKAEKNKKGLYHVYCLSS